jgi:hypothetical protein
MRRSLRPGVDGRIAGHERDAAAVGAEVDGREVGVGGHDAHLVEAQAQLLGHERGHHRRAALPDLRGAGVDGREPAAVELHEDAGLRHVVGVDGVVRARDVHRARGADAAHDGRLRPLRRAAHLAALAFQPLAASTFSRHSRKPLLVTVCR